MRLALVDVGFAARSSKALGTVAGERTGRVDADAVVLARGTCRDRGVTGEWRLVRVNPQNGCEQSSIIMI